MVHDISPLLDTNLAVWPGDIPLSRVVQSETDRGDAVTLSSLRATVHLGSHVDAPSHIASGVPTIDELPLNTFIGPCEVIRLAMPPQSLVQPEHLPQRFDTERILIATGSFVPSPKFNEDFAALSPEAVRHMGDCGVKLVGVDTPSVDLFPGDRLDAHRACLECGIIILEGLVLSDVPAGRYELIALPLKLKGFDASPVRAVLRTDGNTGSCRHEH